MTTLDELLKSQDAIELAIYEKSLELFKPLYTQRSEFISKTPRFWSTAIEASELLSEYISYEDNELLDALENIKVDWDPNNSKNFTITFVFGENEYLSDKELSKTFQFDVVKERYQSEPVEISWKSGKNLTTKKGTNSFFEWFDFAGEKDSEYSEIALIISDEIYPHALKFYKVSLEDAIEPEYQIDSDD